jgi:iron complex transport system ATP-binding protein
MKAGRSIKVGKTGEVLTAELLREVFDMSVLVDAHPISGVPRVTPVHEVHRAN